MRIRFFNTVEPVTSFYRDLMPYLAGHGFQVEVLLSKTEYRAARNGFDEALKYRGIRIVRLPSCIHSPRTSFHKICIMISYVVNATCRALIGPRVDLNFFLTQPPLFAILGLVLRGICGKPYCCLIMDVYPDVAVQHGLLKKSGIFAWFLKAISRVTLKNADMIIVIGRCMQEFLEQQGIPASRIRMVTNWSDENRVFPVARRDNQLRRQLGLEQAFVVLYSGNIGVSHFFDDLLLVIQRLQHLKDIHFVVIGDGVRRQELERAKVMFRLDKLILLPFQPAENLSDSLSIADIHFISLRSGFEGLVVPSKAYGAMAVGRPIIYQGNSSGEIARMISEEKIGRAIPLDEVEGLEAAILEYYQTPGLVEKEGARARRLALTTFSKEASVEKYRKVLAELLKQGLDRTGKKSANGPSSELPG